MVKSKLNLTDHALLLEDQVVEIRYQKEFIGAIYGTDGPGARIVSKYPMTIERNSSDDIFSIYIIEVKIDQGETDGT